MSRFSSTGALVSDPLSAELMFLRALCLFVTLAAAGCLKNHELFQDVAEEPDAGPSAKGADGEACARDEDCVTGTVCTSEVCTACPTATRCRDDFSAIKRNGCTWCTPNNECLSNAECGAGMVCWAGFQCPPGCNDASCCFGNLCSDPSCGPPPSNLDCSRVGCADGSNCVGTGSVDGCACDPTTHDWSCMMQEGANECDPYPGGGPPGGGRM